MRKLLFTVPVALAAIAIGTAPAGVHAQPFQAPGDSGGLVLPPVRTVQAGTPADQTSAEPSAGVGALPSGAFVPAAPVTAALLPQNAFVPAGPAGAVPGYSASALPANGFVPAAPGSGVPMAYPQAYPAAPGPMQGQGIAPQQGGAFPYAGPGMQPGQQPQGMQQAQPAVVGYTATGQPVYLTPPSGIPMPGYQINGLALTPAPGSPPPPPSPGEIEFNQAMSTMFPMTPDMIRQFKGFYSQTQRAIASPAGGTPRAASHATALSLKPGEEPPVLHLYPGNATAVTFSDLTGAPWPVLDVTTGDPNALDAHQAGEKGRSNIVVLSPKTNYASAKNLIVTLVGYPVPIAFQVETGNSGSVDYRLDVSLRARGPNAAQEIITASTLAPTNDSTVQTFLDGMPPRGARKLHTSSREVEAWRYQDMVYLRTALKIMSPAWVGKSSQNISGVSVYTMVDCPVVLVSQDGRFSSVMIDR